VAAANLDIVIEERTGSVRVYDPRLFRAGRRAFCERLVRTISARPGVRRAEVDLATASCRLEFSPGSNTPAFMADTFIEGVRHASSALSRGDKPSWWRRRKDWSALTAYRRPGDASLWETSEVAPGRLRLLHQEPKGSRARSSRLADTLAKLDGVDRCRVSRWSRKLTVDPLPDGLFADRLLDRMEHVLEGLQAAAEESSGPIVVVSGFKRLGYLALAGGAFALTVVALIVPGIPTVPCLLATSYYLARSSPALDERLRRMPIFGQVLQEWETFGRLSRSSKGRLIGLTLVIVVVTVALSPAAPIVWAVVVLVASLSILGIVRMPALAEEPRITRRHLGGTARLSLPAP
jgi:uncharacterized membrane protein YbaN (DUF454 family)